MPKPLRLTRVPLTLAKADACHKRRESRTDDAAEPEARMLTEHGAHALKAARPVGQQSWRATDLTDSAPNGSGRKATSILARMTAAEVESER